jgi:guanine deaminase
LRGDLPERWLSAREVLSAATAGGARALGLGNELGVIRVGARADVFACRTDRISFTPLTDPVRQLVYAERGASVDFSMVAGSVVMESGALTTIDEASILAEIESEYRELESQFAAAETATIPVLEAVRQIYHRSLACTIPADTWPARLSDVATP